MTEAVDLERSTVKYISIRTDLVPPGLRELTAEITTVVLMAQPIHLHNFIAEYLQDQLLARDACEPVSYMIVRSLLENELTYEAMLKRWGISPQLANYAATIIQAVFRGHRTRRLLTEKKRLEEKTTDEVDGEGEVEDDDEESDEDVPEGVSREKENDNVARPPRTVQPNAINMKQEKPPGEPLQRRRPRCPSPMNPNPTHQVDVTPAELTPALGASAKEASVPETSSLASPEPLLRPPQEVVNLADPPRTPPSQQEPQRAEATAQQRSTGSPAHRVEATAQQPRAASPPQVKATVQQPRAASPPQRVVVTVKQPIATSPPQVKAIVQQRRAASPPQVKGTAQQPRTASPPRVKATVQQPRAASPPQVKATAKKPRAASPPKVKATVQQPIAASSPQKPSTTFIPLTGVAESYAVVMPILDSLMWMVVNKSMARKRKVTDASASQQVKPLQGSIPEDFPDSKVSPQIEALYSSPQKNNTFALGEESRLSLRDDLSTTLIERYESVSVTEPPSRAAIDVDSQEFYQAQDSLSLTENNRVTLLLDRSSNSIETQSDSGTHAVVLQSEVDMTRSQINVNHTQTNGHKRTTSVQPLADPDDLTVGMDETQLLDMEHYDKI